MYIGKICQKLCPKNRTVRFDLGTWYLQKLEYIQDILVNNNTKDRTTTNIFSGSREEVCILWRSYLVSQWEALSKSHVRASHPFCPISSVAIQHKELRDWVVKSIACGHQCIKMCRQRDTHVLTSLKLLSAPERCRDGLVCVFIYIYGPFLTYFVVKM